MSLRLDVKDVTKRFGRQPVFSPVSFTAAGSDIVAIVGANGSGKSTLLKIIAGVLSPSSGSCAWSDGDKKLEHEELSSRLGFVAPYLELYNELTAIEHVNFVAQLKAVKEQSPVGQLTRFGLNETIAASSRLTGQYSSGMRQRVALGMAATGDPDILLYDEPSSNLDEEGITLLFGYIQEASRQGKIIILATNDAREWSLTHRSIMLKPC